MDAYERYERAMNEAQIILWIMDTWDESHPQYKEFSEKLCHHLKYLDQVNRKYWEG